MIPITQTADNCWAACAASILEVSLDDLPPYPSPNWEYCWQVWCAERNLFFFKSDIVDLGKQLAIPPGYSILACRVKDYPTEMHALVCLNGEVVWDPNGFLTPRDWNGIIVERDWQIARPVGWTVFGIYDPTKPVGFKCIDIGIETAATLARARLLLAHLLREHPPMRSGAEYGRVLAKSNEIAAAYCDAPSDEEGELAVLKVLRKIKQQRCES